MNIPYFFEENILPGNGSFTLSEETSWHCMQVLRMKEGEKMNLTDGKGNLFTAIIISRKVKKCIVSIESLRHISQQSTRISMAVSLIKNADRFEWFLEKATETGVTEIIPLICERTERDKFRMDRMKGILISAMLQSKQCWLPVLYEPVAFHKVITSSEYIQKLIAHCEENKKASILQMTVSEAVQVLIGPEGDFTHEEIEQAIVNRYTEISLGNMRLRTETAAITAAILLMNHPNKI